MASIVHYKNPKTGIIYAYNSRSYRDKETGKVKTAKTYLGRVDPITGALIPKSETPGKRNTASTTINFAEDAKKKIEELENENSRLKTVIKEKEEFYSDVLGAISVLTKKRDVGKL